MGELPSDTGAAHVTDAEAFPGTATTELGALGVDAGVTGLLTAASDDPSELVATTATV
jgi:hypothetical protein